MGAAAAKRHRGRGEPARGSLGAGPVSVFAFDPWVAVKTRSDRHPPANPANPPNPAPPTNDGLAGLAALAGGQGPVEKHAHPPLSAPPGPDWTRLPFGPERGVAMNKA